MTCKSFEQQQNPFIDVYITEATTPTDFDVVTLKQQSHLLYIISLL